MGSQNGRRTFLKQCAAMPLAVSTAAAESRQRYRIWDLHCHLDGFPGATTEARMDSLARFADRMGVERYVLSLPRYADPAPDQLRTINDELLRALKHAGGRALGMVYVNPNYVEASLREFDRCVRDGPMIGIKLWIARHCNEPELDPIVERAEPMQALVFQHTYMKNQGNLPGESTPTEVAELARRHPKANIVLGHTGADWEMGIRAVRHLKHVTLDLAGSDPTAGYADMAVREVGSERVLYGSDVPGRSFASQLAKVLGADIPDSEKEAILGGNLRRLLAPVMRAKGMTL